MMPIFHLSNHA